MTRFEQGKPAGAGPFYRPGFASELEAQANGRIDRGSLQEAIGETIRHLRPHDAKVCVEALRKSVVRDEGNRVPLSAALREGAGCTDTSHIHSTRLKAVLLLMVIGDTQIDVGPDRIFHTTPKYLEDLVGGKIGVVGGAERISARDETAGRQWIIWVCELHMLIAAIELDRPVRILRKKHAAGVVGGRSRNKSGPLVYTQVGRGCDLRSAERSRRNRIRDVTDDRVDRQAHIVRADLSLDGIAWSAKGSGSDLGFHGGTEGADIHGIFERIVEDTILGISRTTGSSLEADQGESAGIAHGIVVDYAVGS